MTMVGRDDADLNRPQVACMAREGTRSRLQSRAWLRREHVAQHGGISWGAFFLERSCHPFG